MEQIINFHLIKIQKMYPQKMLVQPSKLWKKKNNLKRKKEEEKQINLVIGGKMSSKKVLMKIDIDKFPFLIFFQ